MNGKRLAEIDIETIRALITSKTEETHSLEFKQKSDPTARELSKEDKKNLGEILSGFANATGGTAVIGIKTAKLNGVDCAVSIEPIDAVSDVLSRYQAYISECVAPPILGLTMKAIPDENGRGIIVINIPQGNARRHMSIASGHHRYYRRVSESFVPMQHYEVEEMMRAKISPKLDFVYRIRSAGSIGSNRMFTIQFGLKNLSRVTAKFPYISYENGPGHPRPSQYGLDGNGRHLWPNLSLGSDHATFAAGADQVIHPDQEYFVSQLEYEERRDGPVLRTWAVSQLPDGGSLTLRFSFGCEDHPKQTVKITLTKEDLLNPTH
nr:ATP-binding protein [uncultured Sphingomonas sp.]